MTIPQRKLADKKISPIDEQKLLPDWMMFPALNEAWLQSADGIVALMAERIKTFRELSSSTAPAERVKARLIVQSYVQVHVVLQELNATCKKTAATEQKIFQES
jgi:hypothetical protein